jgi:cytoplasmic iron level regulating protein YaaA (DUF328/UPF0246 family)
VDSPTPAFEVYSGYFYKILKKAQRENEFCHDTDIAILSAKYGMIDTSTEIVSYDRRMDDSRAQELNDDVVEAITQRTEKGGYDRIVVNMGSTYRAAIDGLSEQVDATLTAIPGDGIGEKGNALYQFIRGDDSVLTEIEYV